MQSGTNSIVRGPRLGTTFEDTSTFSVNILHRIQDGTSPVKFGVTDPCELIALKLRGTLVECDVILKTKNNII